MKVLLMKPGNLSDHIQPSLGLGYLAAQVRNDHDITILDCIKEGYVSEQVLAVLEEFKPDVVGSQCYSMDLPSIKLLLQTVKLFNRNIVTIVGGAHPTAAPKHTKDFLGKDLLDFVFVGEGEVGFPKFLEALGQPSSSGFNKVQASVGQKMGYYGLMNVPTRKTCEP